MSAKVWTLGSAMKIISYRVKTVKPGSICAAGTMNVNSAAYAPFEEMRTERLRTEIRNAAVN